MQQKGVRISVKSVSDINCMHTQSLSLSLSVSFTLLFSLSLPHLDRNHRGSETHNNNFISALSFHCCGVHCHSCSAISWGSVPQYTVISSCSGHAEQNAGKLCILVISTVVINGFDNIFILLLWHILWFMVMCVFVVIFHYVFTVFYTIKCYS